MRSCTFFGHRDAPEEMKPKIREAIYALIDRGITCFYVGNQGAFDRMVFSELEKISKEKSIRYYQVLAYFPNGKNNIANQSILPDGIERVHPRFAIRWRNDWMIEKSEIIVAYVYRNYGGAAKFTEKARNKGRKIINLYDK